MTLVLNAGSSSIKFRVFDASSRDVLHGQMERIGVRGTRLTASDGTEREFGESVAHGDAPDALLDWLHEACERTGTKLTAVGHRVVHGEQLEQVVDRSARLLTTHKCA